MKFGHPRLYNPWQSEELAALQRESNVLMNRLNGYVRYANRLVTEQRALQAQMRDCYLTRDEQVARLEALDEVGAPQ